MWIETGMQTRSRLLIIGPSPLREAVSQALPECDTVGTDQPLAGLWQAGHGPFDAVVLSLTAGRNVLRAVHGIRRLCPTTRVVLTCPAADEPGARRAVEEGADEYILEPVTTADLEQALGMRPVALPPAAAVPPAAPTWQEKAEFVDVLQHLAEGPQAALDRLAALLQHTFKSDHVAVEIDGRTAAIGEPTAAVLQEPILRREERVGAITVGQRAAGPFPPATATRLAEYARLIDAVVTLAGDRAHWQDLAWTDDLSRLRNRRYFERRLDELTERCARQHAGLTVLIFDIDDFKPYNDRFGHETGDALIREVASLLVRCSRESDVVARYGGDEFAVVLWDADKPRVPGSRHPNAPVALAERFRKAIGGHRFRCLGPEAPGRVTISGGLASFPWDGRTRADLLRAADEALLTAKQTGKNRIELASGPAPA